MNVLVVGCGKVGSRLARLLAQRGHNVSVIDREEDMFSQLGEDFDGVTVTGMPMDMDVLRNAGVEWCDAVAVVTPDDNLNITISQIVKTFFQFGLSSVCSTNLVVSSLYTTLTQPIEEKQITFLNATLAVDARPVEEMYIGRHLDSVPQLAGEAVMGVLHPGGKVTINDGKSRIELHTGDQILITHLVD